MRLQPLFRDLSSGSRLLLLVLLVLLSGIVSLSISYLIAVALWGRDIFALSGDPDLMNLGLMRLTQMLNQLGLFLIPPFLFAWLCEQKPFTFLGFSKPKNIHLLAAVLLIVAAGPIIGFVTEWNEGLRLPPQLAGVSEWMRSSEDTAAKLTDRFLQAPGASALLINLLMIGLLPSIGEELLFRSALIGLFRKMFTGIHLPVILSALLFSALHLQFFGFVPRFLLGLAFGYLFVWSGSVWIPIIAHFVNNTSVVVASFLFNKGISPVPPDDLGNSISATWIALSAVACLLILFVVYRSRITALETSASS
ncbi:MAG: CPBP family intramembrane metalloprotease [Lentimicrobium sp.]|nr:CPBP family intramembrane metalloprotease [Lentimicrobium sp.]